MIELGDRHRARLATVFVEVDMLLWTGVHALDPATLGSVFSTRVRDATPAQARLLADYAEHMRAGMRAVLDRHRIALRGPDASAAGAARAALERAVVAIEELAPRYMCAYGPLNDETQVELNRIVAQLLGLLDQMESWLVAASDGNLRAPFRARPGFAERDADLLAELARIVDAHDLVQFRPSLAALGERFATRDIEIAVFGRVNSGKSSLLNQRLGAAILPVGMTPVTAVPIYLSYGAQPWGYASFADAVPEKFALGRLPEFAAEHFNPSNLRHVTRLRVELPHAQLKDGITLVDMPGRSFGSPGDAAGVAGSAVRCDVGVVLIDAAAGLTLEEAVIVDALHHAGSRSLVVLTKADLLRPDERWKVQGHVARGISDLTGDNVTVYFASTVATDHRLRDDWVDRALRPLLQERVSVRETSLRRKLDMLQDAVIAALRRRYSLCTDSVASPQAWETAAAALDEAQAALEDAQRWHPDAEIGAESQAGALIDEVAHNAAVLWPQSNESNIDVTSLLTDSLRARAAARAKTAARELRKLRAKCQTALESAATAAAIVRAEAACLAGPGAPPSFEPAQGLAPTVLAQPALAFLGAWRRAAGARAQLVRSPSHRNVANALARHFERVAEWRRSALTELAGSFALRRATLEARYHERVRAAPSEPSVEAQAIMADIETLERFAKQRSGTSASEAQACRGPTRASEPFL